MTKWVWRFLTERNSLWARVVRACKGEIDWDEGGFRLARFNEAKAGWWKKVVGLSWGEGGRWLRDNLVVQIGEGESLLFWHHCWAGEKRLRDKYPRMFRLSSNQGGLIINMGDWVEGVWEWRLEWNRELREREHIQLSDLLSSIRNFTLCAGKTDGWRWTPAPNGMFSVKSAYQTIRAAGAMSGNRTDNLEYKRIWKAPAPYKMKTTAWRIIKLRKIGDVRQLT